MTVVDEKRALRTTMRALRGAISLERREEAEVAALEALALVVREHRYVLSYCSFGHEFPTQMLNRFLEENGQLVLPKMLNDLEMRFYHVLDCTTELEMNSFGISEPIPELCREVAISQLTIVLVPGLGFDCYNNRIGYGKGYYDRFLNILSADVLALGIGYKEQGLTNLLPIEDTDCQLNSILLF